MRTPVGSPPIETTPVDPATPAEAPRVGDTFATMTAEAAKRSAATRLAGDVDPVIWAYGDPLRTTHRPVDQVTGIRCGESTHCFPHLARDVGGVVVAAGVGADRAPTDWLAVSAPSDPCAGPITRLTSPSAKARTAAIRIELYAGAWVTS